MVREIYIIFFIKMHLIIVYSLLVERKHLFTQWEIFLHLFSRIQNRRRTHLTYVTNFVTLQKSQNAFDILWLKDVK